MKDHKSALAIDTLLGNRYRIEAVPIRAPRVSRISLMSEPSATQDEPADPGPQP